MYILKFFKIAVQKQLTENTFRDMKRLGVELQPFFTLL